MAAEFLAYSLLDAPVDPHLPVVEARRRDPRCGRPIGWFRRSGWLEGGGAEDDES